MSAEQFTNHSTGNLQGSAGNNMDCPSLFGSICVQTQGHFRTVAELPYTSGWGPFVCPHCSQIWTTGQGPAQSVGT